jgi:hypothetical protein
MPIPKAEDTTKLLVGGSKMKRDKKDSAVQPDRMVKVVKLWEADKAIYEKILLAGGSDASEEG